MNDALLHNSLIAAHILAVIAWMAGLLYLPRLFIYHTSAEAGSEMDKTFQIMEGRLLRGIMNPAMIVVWLLGIALIWFDSTKLWGPSFLGTAWMSTKFVGVLFLTGFHMYLARARKAFARGDNRHSARFWRLMNEAPFVAAIIMVVAIVTKFGDGRFGG
jgi:putative membrane protein